MDIFFSSPSNNVEVQGTFHFYMVIFRAKDCNPSILYSSLNRDEAFFHYDSLTPNLGERIDFIELDLKALSAAPQAFKELDFDATPVS